MDYTVHGILQAGILEWVAFPFSRGSFQPRDWTQGSCIAGRLPAEPPGKPNIYSLWEVLMHQSQQREKVENNEWCYQFSSVQSLSHVQFFATPWIAAGQASLSITNSRSLLKLVSSWWCHPAISSSVDYFSSCPQSLPASGSFPVSQLFAWGGQSIGVSASASVLPMML